MKYVPAIAVWAMFGFCVYAGNELSKAHAELALAQTETVKAQMSRDAIVKNCRAAIHHLSKPRTVGPNEL